MVDTWRLGIFCSLERCENQVLLPAWTQVGGNGRSLQITPKLDKRHRRKRNGKPENWSLSLVFWHSIDTG